MWYETSISLKSETFSLKIYTLLIILMLKAYSNSPTPKISESHNQKDQTFISSYFNKVKASFITRRILEQERSSLIKHSYHPTLTKSNPPSLQEEY